MSGFLKSLGSLPSWRPPWAAANAQRGASEDDESEASITASQKWSLLGIFLFISIAIVCVTIAVTTISLNFREISLSTGIEFEAREGVDVRAEKVGDELLVSRQSVTSPSLGEHIVGQKKIDQESDRY